MNRFAAASFAICATGLSALAPVRAATLYGAMFNGTAGGISSYTFSPINTVNGNVLPGGFNFTLPFGIAAMAFDQDTGKFVVLSPTGQFVEIDHTSQTVGPIKQITGNIPGAIPGPNNNFTGLEFDPTHGMLASYGQVTGSPNFQNRIVAFGTCNGLANCFTNPALAVPDADSLVYNLLSSQLIIADTNNLPFRTVTGLCNANSLANYANPTFDSELYDPASDGSGVIYFSRRATTDLRRLNAAGTGYDVIGPHLANPPAAWAVGLAFDAPIRKCARIFNEIVICECTCSCYKIKFSLQNQTSTPVYSLGVANVTPANVTVSPTVGTIGPPLDPSGVWARTFNVTGAGAVPGTTVCFEIILRNEAGDEICRTCRCVTLPECKCATVINQSIVPAISPNTYTYKFRFQNRLVCGPNWFSAAHVFLASTSPSVNISPNGFNVTGSQIPACTSPNNGLSGYLTTTITMPNGNGGTACFHIITTNADANCSCKVPSHCITVPPWVQPGLCCYPCPLNGSYSALNIGPAACATLGGTYTLPPPPGSLNIAWCFCSSLWDGVTGFSFFGLAHPEVVPEYEPMFSVVFDGFTGQDGVCFQLNPTNEAWIDIAPFDEALDLAAGSSIAALAHGTVNGRSNQELGSVICRSIGSAGNDDVEIIADFSPIGAATHRIIVSNQEVIVADIGGQSGTIGNAPLMPERFTRGRASGAPDAALAWSVPVEIAVFGGPTVTGDKLLVIAENPAQTVTVLEDLCLSFNGTPDVLILNVGAASVFGDTNCDGIIATSDIQPFVLKMLDPAGYQALYPNCNEFNADFNQDGLIDGLDVGHFVDELISF